MPDFYFFTEPHKLNPQTPEQAFGPLPATATHDQFQTTNWFTASEAPLAIAVTNGIVCVQEVLGHPSLVNIILKPATQPPQRAARVDYYVYRGIQKSSLVKENSSEVATDTNDLTRKIWDSQRRYNESLDNNNGDPIGTTQTKPGIAALGLDIDPNLVESTSPLSELFQPEGLNTNVLPYVKAGETIGLFDPATVGWEVITLTIKYEPRALSVRSLESVVEAPVLSAATPSQKEKSDRLQATHSILSYEDGSSFFNQFFYESLFVHNGVNASRLESQALYDAVLSKFENANTLYFDVRNEFDESFTANADLPSELRINFGDGQFQNIDYYESGWPILRLDSSRFLETPAPSDPQLFSVKYPIMKDSPREIIHKMVDILGEGIRKVKYQEGFWDGVINYTQEIRYKQVAVDDRGFSKILGGTFRISYVGKNVLKDYPHQSNGKEYKRKHLLDNLFPIFQLNIAFPSGSNTVRKTFPLSNFVDGTREGQSAYLCQIGYHATSTSITFFAVPHEESGASSIGPPIRKPLEIIPDAAPQGKNLFEELAERGAPSFLRQDTIDVEGVSYPIRTQEPDFSLQDPAIAPEYESLASITLSRDEYQILHLAAQNVGLLGPQPVYLGFGEVRQGENDKGVFYQLHELVLRGKVSYDGENYEVAEVATGLWVSSAFGVPQYVTPDGEELLDSGLISEVELPKEDQFIKSELFLGVELFQRTLEGRLPIGRNQKGGPNPKGEFVEKIALAIKIVLPELQVRYEEAKNRFDEVHSLVGGLHVSDVFDQRLEYWVKEFQRDVGFPEELVDGIVGGSTLKKLDNELHSIRYYDVDKQKAVHNFSRSAHAGKMTVVSNGFISENDLEHYLNVTDEVEKAAVFSTLLASEYINIDHTVSHEYRIYPSALQWPTEAFPEISQGQIDTLMKARNGVNLRSEPSTDSEIITHLPFNTSVRIIEIVGGRNPADPNTFLRDWCYVEIDPYFSVFDPQHTLDENSESRLRGYVDINYLWTNSELPDPDAKLYGILRNDTLLGISNSFYGENYTLPSGLEVDDRFFANLLLFANNPQGTREKDQYPIDKNTGRYSSESHRVDAAVYLKDESQSWWSAFRTPLPTGLNLVGIPPTVPITKWTFDKFMKTCEEAARTVWGDWGNTEIQTDKLLWLPSKSYIKSVYQQVSVGDFLALGSTAYEIETTLATQAENLYKVLDGTLETLWPKGCGINLDGGLGATFGIPIGVDSQFDFYLWRDANQGNLFHLKRRGVIGGGLDYGIGVGHYLKFGKPAKDPADESEGLGLGVDFGAQVGSGVRFTLLQEYTFDLSKDFSLSNLFFSIIYSEFATAINTAGWAIELGKKYDWGNPNLIVHNDQDKVPFKVKSISKSMIANKLLSAFRANHLNTEVYMTKSKIEIAKYNEAFAAARAGLMIGKRNENFEMRNVLDTRTSDNMRGPLGWGERRLYSLLQISLQYSQITSLGIGAELEIDPKDYILDQNTGDLVPNKIKFSVYAEGSHTRSLMAKLSIFNFNLLPLHFGGGFKVNFEINLQEAFDSTLNLSDENHPLHWKNTFQDCAIYYKQGEFDVFDGPANEIHLVFDKRVFTDLSESPSMTEVIDSMVDSFKHVEIKKRMPLLDLVRGLDKKRGYQRFRKFQKNLSVFIKPDGKIYPGLIFQAFIDLELKAEKENVLTLFSSIFHYVRDEIIQVGHPEALFEMFIRIGKLFISGAPFTFIVKQLNEFLSGFGLQKATAHIAYGIGVSYAAKLALGAKLRLQLFGAGKVTYDRSIADWIEEFLNPDEPETHILPVLYGLPFSLFNITTPQMAAVRTLASVYDNKVIPVEQIDSVPCIKLL